MKHYYHLIIFFSLSALIYGQPSHEDLFFEDYDYVDFVKSVQFTRGGNALAYPIIARRSNSKLILSFDDMNADDYEYRYTIIHCDRNWNPSQIDALEYLSGFDFDEISSRQPNMFTTVNYTHHQLSIPNKKMGWRISGNYLLVIYDDEDQPILTRRFIVHENAGRIEGSYQKSQQGGLTRTHHRVNASYLDAPDFVRNPLDELSLTVVQNFDWLAVQDNVKPSLVQLERVEFNPTKELTFPSLIECRQFDTRSLDYKLMNVMFIDYHQDRIDTYLDTLTGVRVAGEFSTYQDNEGRFVIGKKEPTGSNYNPYSNEGKSTGKQNTYAEYTQVIFCLEVDNPLPGDVYILGKFNSYNPYSEYQMTYNPKSKKYTANVLMKQGFYDYLFGVVEDGSITYEYTEQLEMESSKDYIGIVYYRPFGVDFDRALTVEIIQE